MKQLARMAIAAALAGLACTAAAAWDVPSGQYGLDKTHGYITISYSHLGFSNPHVGFDSFDVNLTADAENPENSQVEVLIDATSVNSRVEEFDGHLNDEDFFDTANYPEITFRSTAVKSTGENTFDVTGDLTIKDVTKPVTLAAVINKAADHPMLKVPTIGVSATAKVSRSAWGLSLAVPYVGDEVMLMIEVELPQKKQDG